ncbi:MAG: hypothetical protein M0Z56_03670, partial [Desulfobacteraceae bacterium]|nr:hypothetical protein [Desulfobacteraceae bacterium]
MNTQKELDTFYTIYDPLTPLEKLIVQIVSFVHGPVDIKSVYQCISKLGEGIHTSPDKLTIYFKGLIKKGFLDKKSNCLEKYRLFASYQAVREKRMKRLGFVMKTVYDLESAYGLWRKQNRLMCFQIGIFSDDEILWKRAYQSNFMHNATAIEEDQMVLHSVKPFVPEIFSIFPEVIQCRTLCIVLNMSIAMLHDDSDVFSYAIDFYPRATTVDASARISLFAIMVIRLLQTGRFDEAGSMITGMEFKHLNPFFSASIDALKGNYPVALSLFDEQFAILKKVSRKKIIPLNGFPGYIYVLVSFKYAKSEDLPKLSGYLAKCLKECDQYQKENTAFYYLSLMVDQAMNPTREIPDQPDIYRINAITDTEFMFAGISEFARTGRLRPEMVKRLAVIYTRTTKSDCSWFTAECAELLIRSGNGSDDMVSQVERIKKDQGIIPLVTLIEQKELWEKQVDALLGVCSPAVVQQGDSGQNKAQSRMIWVIHYDDRETIALMPREQKMAASGKWSKGKDVALQRIVTGKNLDFMSPEDKLISAGIASYHEWNKTR